MNRLLDIIFSIIAIAILFIPIVLIALFIFIFSGRPTLHWSKRVGENSKIFLMPKFRSMKLETPQTATHLFKNPNKYLIFGGSVLRQFSLDELPQLYSILEGKMKFVGPRPALYNQYDLIELRQKKGIDKIKPGITGWAQVNGRDELSIKEKVLLDEEYLRKRSLFFDILIIIRTLSKLFENKDIKH